MRKGRRKKVRYIQEMPPVALFSPRGRPGRPDEIELKVDEFEALKLADYQGYDQSEGAQAMGISRASFGRILRNARKVLATAIVEGCCLRIRIGDVQVGVRQKNLPKKDRKPVEIGDVEKVLRENILKYTRKDQ
ncbi:MAG: DUF134 domain-containing protein [Candidatus Omnitrophica bacterium]|nr:DUF134 domain-containing protein [Candidatus Omnitrophota bacterium]